jgi:hypothetical protein
MRRRESPARAGDQCVAVWDCRLLTAAEGGPLTGLHLPGEKPNTHSSKKPGKKKSQSLNRTRGQRNQEAEVTWRLLAHRLGATTFQETCPATSKSLRLPGATRKREIRMRSADLSDTPRLCLSTWVCVYSYKIVWFGQFKTWFCGAREHRSNPPPKKQKVQSESESE